MNQLKIVREICNEIDVIVSNSKDKELLERMKRVLQLLRQLIELIGIES